MKNCSICKENKDTIEFNKNKYKKDGYQNVCKKCNRERSRKYYDSNKELHKINIKNRKAENKLISRKKLNEYLKEHPCIDCGYSNIIALEFDHREMNSKYSNVSEMIGVYSWNKIEDEINKCDVRCSNCHRIKTAIQLGYIHIYDL